MLYPETDAFHDNVVSQRGEGWALGEIFMVVPHYLCRPPRLSFEDYVRLVRWNLHLLSA